MSRTANKRREATRKSWTASSEKLRRQALNSARKVSRHLLRACSKGLGWTIAISFLWREGHQRQ